jgi:hypothetical protein
MYSALAWDVEFCSFSVHLLRLNDLERFSALRVDNHSSLQGMAKDTDLELRWPVAKELDVTEDEVEAVAEELAKAGGVAWYPGRSRGPLLRMVSDRYRDRARLAIAALDRYRAHKAGVAPADTPDSIDVGPIPEQPQAHAPSDSGIRVGTTVVYRPPGEQRAYPCRVEKIEGGRAYLVPFLRPWTSWVPIQNITPVSPEEDSAP